MSLLRSDLVAGWSRRGRCDRGAHLGSMWALGAYREGVGGGTALWSKSILDVIVTMRCSGDSSSVGLASM